MSKRFNIAYGGNVITDKDGRDLNLSVKWCVEELVGLLNEQQATIEAKDKEIAELDQQCADFLGDKIKALEEFEECTDKLKAKIVEQQATIEQLRTQLLICQQSNGGDGRFQVWEVPPIPKGMRITSFTTSDGDKDE